MLDDISQKNNLRAIASIRNLRVEFQTKDGPVVGVEDVSFEINPGETVCVVGESGSGKSVSSLSLMRLVEFGGGEITGGQLLFNRAGADDIDFAKSDAELMRKISGNDSAVATRLAVRTICHAPLRPKFLKVHAMKNGPIPARAAQTVAVLLWVPISASTEPAIKMMCTHDLRFRLVASQPAFIAMAKKAIRPRLFG